MTSLVFPDINVWLALNYSHHAHHERSNLWFESLDHNAELIFCRFTQMGLLRLLTTSAVMGAEVKTQRQAWRMYDVLLRDGVRFMQEPRTLDESFRSLARLNSASPKDWADLYLAAFAAESGAGLVTFDKALAKHAVGAVLL
ncbi:type II toxin-antitoxin system VapC family toxin [soil metagenome]